MEPQLGQTLQSPPLDSPLQRRPTGLYNLSARTCVILGQWCNKPVLVTPVCGAVRCGAVMLMLCRAVRTALGRFHPITSLWTGGGGVASVTVKGPWSRAQSSSVERRHHVQVHGLLTGLLKQRNLHLKAQYYFHLTVIHEILQAYLQVLRRLLLNLLCQR